MILRNHPLPLYITESVTADPDGRFEIDGIPSSAHDVEITATAAGDDGATTHFLQRTLDPVDGPFELTLE